MPTEMPTGAPVVDGPHVEYWRSLLAAAGERDGRLNAATIPIDSPRALLWRRLDGSTVEISGAELQHRAGELAAVLAALGVGRGERVAGMLGRRPESFALPLAVWRLGAVYVPLFSGFGPDAAHVRLADCEAGTLVVDADNTRTAAAVAARLPALRVLGVGEAVEGRDGVEVSVAELLPRAGDPPAPVATEATETATIMYTSGTSGSPKGCMLAHYGAVTLWPNVEHALGASAGDVLFATADAGWSYGLYTTGLAPITRGVTRVLYEGAFDPAAWWEIARELEVDHLASAPTGYRQLAAAGPEAIGPPPPHLRAATSCGEPLTAEIGTWFEQQLGLTIHDSYGLTELGILVADLRGPGREAPRDGSMGTVLPGFEVELLDDDLRPVPEGEAGRVAVRDHGLLLSRGYWNRMSEWNERLREGWWLSEDIARREGERYWYVGRADDVIVTAGYNVGPTDVEEILLEHAAVADAACVGQPDERKGQAIAAHVVLAAPCDTEALLEELRQSVGERLGWHAAPRALHVAAELPRTESGKVRRRELRG